MDAAIEDVRPATRVAIAAVRRGLELTRARAGAEEIASKGGRDLVTATDIAVEDEIGRVVGDASPHPVVGEERGGEAPPTGRPTGSSTPSAAPRTSRPVSRCTASTLRWWRAIGSPSRSSEMHRSTRSSSRNKVEERGPRSPQGHRRLATSGQNQTIVLESGHATGARREHSARFAQDAIRADRWDHPNLSSTLSLPYVSSWPGRSLRAVLSLGAPRRGGDTARRGGRRDRVRHRGRTLDP